MLDEREGFLRTIFATPEDDAPRLVYADWLDEHGYSDHATLIRIQCELARRPTGARARRRRNISFKRTRSKPS